MYKRQFYALFNRVSLFQMKVDKNKCVSCGKCARACKMDVDVTKTPNHTECIRCGMCVNNCPVGAIDRNDPTKVDASLCLRCLSCVRLCPLGSKAFTDPGFQKTVAWCLENFQKPDKSPAFFL